MDNTIQVVRDKEINNKVPLFSLISTIEVVSKAINMKAFLADQRKDDGYICAGDGEEFLPP